MISKTIFRIIDGLILCANKLCGIDTVNFNGEDTDFLGYLMFSEEVSFAFKVSALLAFILLIVFTIFMIIRSIVKDKSEGTPVQIAMKAFKTLLTFFLVPAAMIAFMTIGNAFVSALYSATAQDAATPGAFLFAAFAKDGGMRAEYVDMFRTGQIDYYSTAEVSARMNLSEFPFLFSWLAGGVALFGIGSAMLVFVDRVLSIVILYIASPISIASSVLDDGARFKLWRDQFFSKFIMGYGMIIAINIYALVCGLVTKPEFAFFPGEGSSNAFLDLIMKLLVIGGGALTMQKSMALIGNLVSSGAGSNELRDNAFSMGSLARMAKGAAGFAAGKALSAAGYLTGAKAVKSIAGDALAMQSRHLGARALSGLGLGGGNGATTDKNGVKDPDGSSGSKNNEKANYGSNPNSAKDAINDVGFKRSFTGVNNNKTDQNKGNTVNNIINNGGNSQTKQQGNGEANQNNQNNNIANPNQQNGGK